MSEIKRNTEDKQSAEVDSTLITRAIDGDNKAFETLILRYHETTQQLLITRIGNTTSADIDDIMQESFTKAFINLQRYDKRHSFGGWFYTIARNTAIDFFRRRNEDLSIDELVSSTPEELAPNPEQRIINSQQRTKIEECISQLPKRQAELFRLRFLDELSYEEIAQLLDIPLGSVKTNIHRARQTMMRLLSDN